MTGNEIHKRTTAFDRDAGTIRLHAPEWKLLLAFDGRRTLAEVALGAGTLFAQALPLTEKFLASGWIEEQPITLDQYLKRTGAPDPFGAVPPAVVLHSPKADASAAATPEQPAVQRRGPMRLSAVVNHIIAQADNVQLGQLAVYRVFLRVPHDLLQADDIVSVNLANDTSLIRGEALQEAVAEAVHEVARQPLPDSVYAVA